MSNKLLDISDLIVEYETDFGWVRAVNSINLTVNKGETLGVVGESGAGKTTTALSIMKLLPHNIGEIKSGSIVFKETDLLKASESDMRAIRGNNISMIFQDPMTSLNPVITVGNQILEVIALHYRESKSEQNRRVDEILELVGIPSMRKNEYPHQFSGGMKQRIVIAIALACNPELIIADEPTTALDVTIQAQVLERIKTLKEDFDTSMILITHDLGVVAEMCDKVAIMYSGEILESGSIFQIFDRGKNHHPYTTGLFGSIPNINEEADRLKPIDGLMPSPRDQITGCKFHPRCPEFAEICKKDVPSYKEQDGHIIKCHFR